MKQIVIFTFLAAFLIAGFGCSQKQSNSAESDNANVAVESKFADITDANVALAEGNRLLDENQTHDDVIVARENALIRKKANPIQLKNCFKKKRSRKEN